MAMTEPDSSGTTSERHATNLELFLDLVFVFAVTQIAGVLASADDAAGFGRGLLLAWLVWWLWSQFTWLGTAIDLTDRSLNQFLILAAIPLALLMAVAIPDAFGATGREFAAAYLAVNLWALGIQGRGLWGDPATRRAWVQYAPLAIIAPCLLLLGAFLDEGPRTALWCLVALVDVVSAIVGGRRSASGENTWRIDPLHFVERHSLFVIISLGEVLVAVGVATSGLDLDVTVGLGLLATVSVACAFWWIYFSYIPGVVEARLRASRGLDRGRVARNALTFGHFPIVFGIVLYAVAAKHAVVHPTDPLAATDRFALGASIAFFVGGFMGLQWQAVRAVAPERVLSIAIVAALCAAVGPHVAGTVLIAIVGAVLVTAHTITLRRFTRLFGGTAAPPTAAPPTT